MCLFRERGKGIRTYQGTFLRCFLSDKSDGPEKDRFENNFCSRTSTAEHQPDPGTVFPNATILVGQVHQVIVVISRKRDIMELDDPCARTADVVIICITSHILRKRKSTSDHI